MPSGRRCVVGFALKEDQVEQLLGLKVALRGLKPSLALDTKEIKGETKMSRFLFNTKRPTGDPGSLF